MKDRDLFAAFALAGFLKSLSPDEMDEIDQSGDRVQKEHQLAAAKWCYGYADAMMKARGKK